MRSGRRPKTQAGSPDSTCSASSTSLLPQRWHTGSTRRRTRRSWFSTSAAAPSTFPYWTSAKESLKSARPPAIRTWAGDDFDKRLVDWMAEAFLHDQGIDLRKDRQALQRLTEAAEKAKIELSSVIETAISLPFITADASGPKHLETKLTRAKFEQLTADLVERCVQPVKQALSDAKLTAQ